MNFRLRCLFLMVLSIISLANASSRPSANDANQTSEKLGKLEKSFNGKIGVYAINTANNEIIQSRANERFPVQSTLKLIGVAALLSQSTANNNLLQRKIHYAKDDLISWHPITGKYVTGGMTLIKQEVEIMELPMILALYGHHYVSQLC